MSIIHSLIFITCVTFYETQYLKLPRSVHKYSMELPWKFHDDSMELHAIHEVSVELHKTPWSVHGTLQNSMELTWKCMGLPWNYTEFLRSPWNSTEFREVPWNSMERCGIPWGYFTRAGRYCNIYI